MKVSVIIPSLYEHDHEYLELCVKSLKATTNWDIIVVTNGTKVKPALPFTCLHLHTSGQGQCNAVNIGSQVAMGDYILVSNSDMYYAPGWDKNLRFDHPVFSPNLVEPTDNLGSAPPFLKYDGGWDIKDFKQKNVDMYIKAQISSKKMLFQGQVVKHEETGFNLPFFIKRDLYHWLGGYDIAYDPWGSNSDTDLQTRINLAGVTPMRLKDVLVYHFSNKTPTFSPENDKFRQFNFDYFYEKFGFDRDELGSDVWYNKDMLPKDKKKIRYEQAPYIS